MSADTATLASRAIDGDEAAFGTLYRRHVRLVLTYASQTLGDAIQAEDVCQEVFACAHRRLHDLRDPTRFKPWLMAITRRMCIDHMRRRREIAALPPDVSTDGFEDDLISLQGGRTLIAAALTRLPSRQRRALRLREWEGLSYSETAAELGTSTTAVETLLHRARQTLKTEVLRLTDGRWTAPPVAWAARRFERVRALFNGSASSPSFQGLVATAIALLMTVGVTDTRDAAREHGEAASGPALHFDTRGALPIAIETVASPHLALVDAVRNASQLTPRTPRFDCDPVVVWNLCGGIRDPGGRPPNSEDAISVGFRDIVRLYVWPDTIRDDVARDVDHASESPVDFAHATVEYVQFVSDPEG